MADVRDTRDLALFVHSELDDYGLDVYEFRVYARIARRAGARGVFNESAVNVGAACGISPRRVRYAWRLLEAAGLIEVVPVEGKPSDIVLTPASRWVDPDAIPGLREQVRHPKPDTPAPGAGVEAGRNHGDEETSEDPDEGRDDPRTDTVEQAVDEAPSQGLEPGTPLHHVPDTPAPGATHPCTRCSQRYSQKVLPEVPMPAPPAQALWKTPPSTPSLKPSPTSAASTSGR